MVSVKYKPQLKQMAIEVGFGDRVELKLQPGRRKFHQRPRGGDRRYMDQPGNVHR